MFNLRLTKIAALVISLILLVGCQTAKPATVNVNVSGAEKVTINQNDETVVTIEEDAEKSRKIQKPRYLSKMVLENGPCPERDSKSYGLLVESKTEIRDGQIICYYN